MAYEKQTWAKGDVVTSAKLNHMEDGIAAGGVYTVTSTYDEQAQGVVLDKNYNEIKAALLDGKTVIISDIADSTEYYNVVCAVSHDGSYMVQAFGDSQNYISDSATGVLVWTELN